MKKILAIALAAVMVMALSISAFAAETVVYKMNDNDTLGQLLEDVTISSGTPITIEHDEYAVGARIATPWVNGSTYDGILEGIKTEGAVLRLTYTGNITAIGFQTEVGGMETTPITDVTVVDGKNVAIIPCADIVAAAPIGVANDNVGWANFLVTFEGEIAFYGLEIVTGYEPAAADEAPVADETPADETPAVDEAPAADETPAVVETPAPAAETAPAPTTTTTAPATGLALAVVPAVVALAAVAVAKKH